MILSVWIFFHGLRCQVFSVNLYNNLKKQKMTNQKKTTAENAREALKMAANTLLKEREANGNPITLKEIIAMADNNFEELQKK